MKKAHKGKLFEYFIKALPVTNELNRNLVDELCIFPKEVNFYTDLFNEMEKYTTCNWHPKCYYTRPDLLVFENLTHFGFRNLDDNEQITEQHLQVTLKCMAQMHCSSIVFEKKTGLCIGEKYKSNLFEISLNDTTGWFRAGLMAVRAAAKKIPKYQNENINEITPDPDNYEFLENFANPSKIYLNTFCHRDIWSRNILFKYDENTNSIPKQAIFVDFQNCTYCPPAIDFMMFFVLNQNSEDRKKNFDWCTKFYYDNLKNMLKNFDLQIDSILSFDEFLLTCNEGMLLPLVFKGVYLPFINTPDNYFFVNLRKNDPAKYDSYLKNNRDECVLKFIDESDEFRKIMFETVEDLIENFIKYKCNKNLQNDAKNC
ncbi:uncharacterized protein LOC129615491 isoform X2 [Condylostylus longicornis]|uniref:uncharacterized protein LOC129615491 isoform X2 n=1 Tax=Condylostylus longicornis TaxID=2530218 RepID=UPI00244E41F7|nr:uncharacterized protein LOC129615491 isoform X2 [Condylostylus longicornis]